MIVLEWSEESEVFLQWAVNVARLHKNANLTPIHLALAGLIKKDPFEKDDDADEKKKDDKKKKEDDKKLSLLAEILKKAGIDHFKFTKILRAQLEELPKDGPSLPVIRDVGLSKEASQVFEKAERLATASKDDKYIARYHILGALFQQDGIKAALEEAGIKDVETLQGALLAVCGDIKYICRSEKDCQNQRSPYLVSLTELYESGQLNPLIGRSSIIQQVINKLYSRSKSCACLIGEAGVGKTAIAEGLAEAIAKGNCPNKLRGAEILSLDLVALKAGCTLVGQHESRVKSLISYVEKASDNGKPIIIFIDEMHLLCDKSENMDAANMFKIALARGKIRVLGATTSKEYKKHIERDAALSRRFTPIKVPEPDRLTTLNILQGHGIKNEIYYNVRILYSGLEAAVDLAKKFFSHRSYPDSAIDLLEAGCSTLAVALDTVPKDIAEMRNKVDQLELSIRWYKGDPSRKIDLESTQKELQDLQAILKQRESSHQQEMDKYNEIAKLKKELEDCKIKEVTAARANNADLRAELRHRLIPRLEDRLNKLEAEEKAREDQGIFDQKTTVTAEVVAAAVAEMIGVSTDLILQNEAERMANLPKLLGNSIKGQKEAINNIARMVKRCRGVLKDEKRPESFLFLGVSGCGKTYCAQVLAEVLYPGTNALIEIHGGDYTMEMQTNRFTGSAPGYVGYGDSGPFDSLRESPHQVILVDEVEKMTASGHKFFLQVLDGGYFINSSGFKIDFGNTIIIFTSNVGAKSIANSESDELTDEIQSNVIRELGSHFAPEFINRMKNKIIFKRLSKEAKYEMIDSMLEKREVKLARVKYRVKLSMTEGAKDYIYNESFKISPGSREIDHTLSNLVDCELEDMHLRGELTNAKQVKIELNAATCKLDFTVDPVAK